MESLIGLAGVPIIREIIQLVKPTWANLKISGLITVLVALVLGIALNVAIALVQKGDLIVAIGYGIVTGLLSNVWNTALKMSK